MDVAILTPFSEGETTSELPHQTGDIFHPFDDVVLYVFAFLSSRIHKAFFRNCSFMEHACITVGESLSDALPSHIPYSLILVALGFFPTL